MKVPSDIEKKVVESALTSAAFALVGPTNPALICSLYSFYEKIKEEAIYSYISFQQIFNSNILY